MGMFDDFLDDQTVHICPKCKQKQIAFQTKDLDCTLGLYRINTEGYIEQMERKFREPRPDEQYDIGGMKLPLMVSDNVGWKEMSFTGSINFYSPCDECGLWWFELVCLVKHGKVIDIEDHSHEN